MSKTKGKLGHLKFEQTPREGKSAAIYVRVSEDAEIKDSKGNNIARASVETQKKDLIAYAKKKGWQYKIYDQDCDISGAENIENRPALTEIVSDIYTGKIHTVIIRE